ncbi:MAG: hypothetical protein ACO3RG_02655 [Nitriliruptoraceae bacterium]
MDADDGAGAERDEVPASRLEDLLAARRAKLDELRAAGVAPHPPRFRPTAPLAELAEAGFGHLA